MGDTIFSTDRAHELRYMQKCCQLKQSTDISAQWRVINTLIPLMSIAFSVYRLWTVPVCEPSCVYPLVEN